MTTTATPVRYPDLRSRPLMNKRAWWLVGMNFLVPGSAQVLAGNRRLGRFGLGTTLLFWALVVVGVAAALIGRTSILSFLVNPIVLWVVTAVLVFYGVVWLICTLDTLRLVRFVRLDGVVRIGTALLAIGALVLSGGAAFGAAWFSGSAAVVAAKVGSNTVDIPGGPVGPITGPVNILLVGSDSGGGNAAYGARGENLNDVTILIHISPASKSATAVSIPRDLFVPQPECTKSDGSVSPAEDQIKFNNALTRGGLACVASSVTQLTGLPIQYAGLIEFDGVVAMSDAVGGVPVCVSTPIDDPYSGLVLDAGENTLQGAQALAFLRTRHGTIGGGDLSRISNQQVFLSALMRKVKDGSTLSDPVKLVNLANAAADHMTLSKSLAQTSTMVSLALTLRDVPLDRIAFVQYPSRATYVRGLSVAVPLTDAAAALTGALAKDQAVATSTLGDAAQSNPGATTPTPSTTPTPGPSPSATTQAPVQLPDTVSGQSAAQQTCSRGQG